MMTVEWNMSEHLLLYFVSDLFQFNNLYYSCIIIMHHCSMGIRAHSHKTQLCQHGRSWMAGWHWSITVLHTQQQQQQTKIMKCQMAIAMMTIMNVYIHYLDASKWWNASQNKTKNHKITRFDQPRIHIVPPSMPRAILTHHYCSTPFVDFDAFNGSSRPSSSRITNYICLRQAASKFTIKFPNFSLSKTYHIVFVPSNW